MTEERKFKPLVKLTGLYENKSQRTGETYFSGFLGAAKVVILRDKNPEPGQKTTWNLCIQEKEPKPDQEQPQGHGQQGYGHQAQHQQPQTQQGYQRQTAPAAGGGYAGQQGFQDDIPF